MATHLVNDRETALRIGYDATEWTTPVGYEDYKNAMQDWDVALVMKNDEPCGAMFSRGEELHFSILPEWRKRWLTKRFLRELFDGRRIVTRVTAGHDYMYDVLARLGFNAQPDGLLVKDAQHGY
jgi:hypothetical protein